ncbi:MAG: 23S rRNA (guanosine(2251)-2'-O)-methyltransferase RlmB [Candidatus Rariloculaceae bacterium]
MAKGRTGAGKRCVYGVHAVTALLDKRPAAIVSVKLLRGSSAGKLPKLARALEALDVPVERLARADLDRLAQGGAHQGVVVETKGAAEVGIRELEQLVIDRGRSFRALILDGVDDPRNLGACLRTADAAGMDAVIVPRNRAAKLTPVAIKAATGAAETVRLVRVANLAATIHWLKDAGVWIVGASAESPRTVYAARLETPIVLALGGEGRGLRRLTRELCDELVSIPMQGVVESLNVSVATGVLLFELGRQMETGRPRRHDA